MRRFPHCWKSWPRMNIFLRTVSHYLCLSYAVCIASWIVDSSAERSWSDQHIRLRPLPLLPLAVPVILSFSGNMAEVFKDSFERNFVIFNSYSIDALVLQSILSILRQHHISNPLIRRWSVFFSVHVSASYKIMEKTKVITSLVFMFRKMFLSLQTPQSYSISVFAMPIHPISRSHYHYWCI